ncbi:NAD(P)/FAD-dependent oxidoreductase [Aureliella helgolandensis]|uniref:Protoporphyrinogen oxidase n=1 Tax=Aureliella helgolandensis TaxID=2527968 RepID=A0A518G3S1_9BACT|nr:FAD-dependent oxidoreductase [Aureliella helgolandensis]QDV23246.1 protoporphyrinogen oxidase [Aureliella helgolandensis]
MRIAVIGSGISGCLVARILSTQHSITVFEASHYAGGHANTVDVELEGVPYPVDTGFMVFNRKTYPNFCRLLEILDVASQPSDMSFSVRCDSSGVEYQGSSLNGIFAQRANLLSPSFLRMLRDIVRFNRAGMSAAQNALPQDEQSVGEFLTACGVGETFLRQYLVPMAAAIWSSTPQSILDFPASFLVGFFANHGLMQLRDRPQWRTIRGGAREYVDALLKPIADRVKLNSPVDTVIRSGEEVAVKSVGGRLEVFDQVVFATHSDQALRMLAAPTPAEREVLGAIPYHANTAVLHTDTRVLPSTRRAWASWNYRISEDDNQNASVTYDLSRLQNHHSPTPILLTLNPSVDIAAGSVIRSFHYQHPAYCVAAIAAQRRLHEINGRNQTHFCGAYWGYGFHEDGVNSALEVTKNFGLNLESCIAASTRGRSATAAMCL